MYIELAGRWISGPLDPTIPARVPVQIDWPIQEAGTISLVLVDENDAPVILDLTTDNVTLSIGVSTDQGSLLRFKARASATGDLGRYMFDILNDAFQSVNCGPYIYDVTVTRVVSAVTQRQAVLPLAYWNLRGTSFDGPAS